MDAGGHLLSNRGVACLAHMTERDLMYCTIDRPCGSCYGCRLRAKSLNVAGETVAKYVRRDTAEHQTVVAGLEIEALSQRMQAGGAVAEDALQAPIQKQYARIRDAAREQGAGRLPTPGEPANLAPMGAPLITS